MKKLFWSHGALPSLRLPRLGPTGLTALVAIASVAVLLTGCASPGA